MQIEGSHLLILLNPTFLSGTRIPLLFFRGATRAPGPPACHLLALRSLPFSPTRPASPTRAPTWGYMRVMAQYVSEFYMPLGRDRLGAGRMLSGYAGSKLTLKGFAELNLTLFGFDVFPESSCNFGIRTNRSSVLTKYACAHDFSSSSSFSTTSILSAIWGVSEGLLYNIRCLRKSCRYLARHERF